MSQLQLTDKHALANKLGKFVVGPCLLASSSPTACCHSPACLCVCCAFGARATPVAPPVGCRGSGGVSVETPFHTDDFLFCADDLTKPDNIDNLVKIKKQRDVPNKKPG